MMPPVNVATAALALIVALAGNNYDVTRQWTSMYTLMCGPVSARTADRFPHTHTHSQARTHGRTEHDDDDARARVGGERALRCHSQSAVHPLAPSCTPMQDRTAPQCSGLIWLR